MEVFRSNKLHGKTFFLLVFYIVLSVFLQKKSCAQHSQGIVNYRKSNGLLSNEIYDIASDSLGRIYIAGERGVNRYDGFEFYNIDKDQLLQNTSVYRFCKDKKSQLWLMCADGRVFKVKENTIDPHPFNERILKTVVRSSIFLEFDVSEPDKLVLGTKFNGIYKFYEDSVEQIKCDQSERLCCDVSVYDPVITRNHCPLESENISFLDSSGKVVLSTNQSFNVKNARSTALRSSRGNVFISNQSRIIDYNTRSFHNVGHSIISLGEYADSLLLIGTRYEGAKLYDPYRKVFMDSWLDELSVSACHHSGQGIWFGTLSDGVFFLPNPEYNYFKAKVSASNLLDLKVVDTSLVLIYEDPSIEVINLSNEIKQSNTLNLKSDSEFRSFHSVGAKINKNHSIIDGQPPAILHTGNVKLSKISTFFNGNTLRSINIDSARFIGYNYRNIFLFEINNEGFQPIWIENIDFKIFDLHLFGNSVLVSTNKGLFSYELTSGTRSFVSSLSETLFFQRKGGSSMYFIDPKGSIYEIDNLQQSVKFKKKLDLKGVTSVITLNSLLVIGTFEGLFVYQISDFAHVNSLNNYDGLISKEIIGLETFENNIYTLHRSGVSVLPVNELFAKPKFQLSVKEVSVNDKITNQKRFRYNENSIQIVFYPIDLVHGPDRKLYGRLATQNGEWQVYPDYKVRLDYLEPGNYILEYKTSYDDVNFSKTKRFEFTIEAPYWRSTWFIILIAITVVIIIISILLWIRLRIKRKNRIELQILELKAAALKAQMNPHFIYNVLNSIQSIIFSGDSDTASIYLADFAELHRKVLDYSSLNSISLNEELELVSQYVYLENLRFNGKIVFQIDSDIKKLNIEVPPLIIQPLVENSVVHGFKRRNEGLISISIENKEEFYVIKIEDDGAGFEQYNGIRATSQTHKSKGVELTKSRLKILHRNNTMLLDNKVKNGKVIGAIVKIIIWKK